jgi:hypothetical protein
MITEGDVYHAVFGFLRTMKKLGLHDLKGRVFWSAQRTLAHNRYRYVNDQHNQCSASQ